MHNGLQDELGAMVLHGFAVCAHLRVQLTLGESIK